MAPDRALEGISLWLLPLVFAPGFCFFGGMAFLVTKL